MSSRRPARDHPIRRGRPDEEHDEGDLQQQVQDPAVDEEGESAEHQQGHQEVAQHAQPARDDAGPRPRVGDRRGEGREQQQLGGVGVVDRREQRGARRRGCGGRHGAGDQREDDLEERHQRCGEPGSADPSRRRPLRGQHAGEAERQHGQRDPGQAVDEQGLDDDAAGVPDVVGLDVAGRRPRARRVRPEAETQQPGEDVDGPGGRQKAVQATSPATPTAAHRCRPKGVCGHVGRLHPHVRAGRQRPSHKFQAQGVRAPSGLSAPAPPGAGVKIRRSAPSGVVFSPPRSGGAPHRGRGGMVSTSAAARLRRGQLIAALEALPDGVAVFDADWTVCYINPAGAALLERRAAGLTGRSIWAALPEVAGSIFHSFLLHARSVGTPVTWQGFYAPAGRWLSATAVVVDGLLHVSFRDTGAVATGGGRESAEADEPADRDRLRYLAEVSEAMIATLDTGESATRLAELAVSRLCDWAVVALIGDDGGPGEEAWAHRDPARRGDLDTYLNGRLRNAGDDEAMVGALLSGEPVQVTTIDEELVAPSLPTEDVRAAWRLLDTTSCTIVPLRARGETFGALAMMNAGARSPHTELEIATAVEVARRGGLALDNARLYGRQLKVAETLQLSLLTPPPEPEGLEIAVRYRPAAVYQQVGGDWYDAFGQPDGATLLVIGDVVGHNVDAAAAMGQIRSILRGIAYDRPESPAQVLTRVDGVLTGLRIGTLATALGARLGPPGGRGQCPLRWSSAGHLPPLLIRTDATVQLLDTPPERLLGTQFPRVRGDHEVELRAGDTVVLYTDGLIEHARTGIDEGIGRLTGLLPE